MLAVALRLAGLDVLFNLAKLFALVALGFWFLPLFETVLWVVLVALVIPWVDAFSVWRGPTDYVVSEQPQVFEDLSIAFRVPGEHGTANLGPPDILFFALFLGAADRWPPGRVDVGRDDGAARRDADPDGDDDVAGLPALPGDLHRLPAPERRPALA